MKKAPTFLFVRDFLMHETAHLSLAATGAFACLLRHQWLDGALPAEVPQLAKLLGTTTRTLWPIWREIAVHFPASPDGRSRANPALRRLASDPVWDHWLGGLR